MEKGSARIVVALAGISVVALGGCTATSPESNEPVELTVASYIGFDSIQNGFMIDLESMSDGSIDVEKIGQWTVSGTEVEAVEDEVGMTQATIDGDVDLTWTTTRTLHAVGIEGVEAIDAPFAITSRAAQRVLIESGGEDAVFDALADSGLTGLALLPGSVRYPLSIEVPLREPAEWAGRSLSYLHAPAESSAAAQTILALGGEPVYVGLHYDEDMIDGLYDGAQIGLSPGLLGTVPFVVTDAPLWPRMEVLVVNTATWESLTEPNRALILRLVDEVKVTMLAQEDDPGTPAEMCAQYVRFAVPSAEQAAELRAAVEPVYDWLRADPREAALLELVELAGAAHPADPLDIPEDCLL